MNIIGCCAMFLNNDLFSAFCLTTIYAGDLRMRIQQPQRSALAGILMLLLSIGISPAQESSTPADLAIKTGDYCIVGFESSDHLDNVIIYKGRRVGVCPPHAAVLENPDSLDYYFATLQPRSALYHEEAIQGASRPIQTGWFYFGIWVAIALLAAALSTGVALRKGLPAVKWFFIGLVGSIFGLILTLMQQATATISMPPHLGKLPVTLPPLICKTCGAQNHPSAKQCPNCQAELQPGIESEVKRT